LVKIPSRVILHRHLPLRGLAGQQLDGGSNFLIYSSSSPSVGHIRESKLATEPRAARIQSPPKPDVTARPSQRPLLPVAALARRHGSALRPGDTTRCKEVLGSFLALFDHRGSMLRRPAFGGHVVL